MRAATALRLHLSCLPAEVVEIVVTYLPPQSPPGLWKQFKQVLSAQRSVADFGDPDAPLLVNCSLPPPRTDSLVNDLLALSLSRRTPDFRLVFPDGRTYADSDHGIHGDILAIGEDYTATRRKRSARAAVRH